MTCDERLEALLNKAGQTLADLPKPGEKHTAYPAEMYGRLVKAAQNFDGMTGDALLPIQIAQYALHLTDIIDRMEWALDKTLREKAYIRAKCCYICGMLDSYDTANSCEECLDAVPDEWREDDA